MYEVLGSIHGRVSFRNPLVIDNVDDNFQCRDTNKKIINTHPKTHPKITRQINSESVLWESLYLLKTDPLIKR